MFYNAVVNEWGETTYVPTPLGNALLVLIIAVLLAGAMILSNAQKKRAAASGADITSAGSKTRLSVKQLAFCAMTLALGTLLSGMKIFSFPWGGSVTWLSMLVICLPGYLFGLGVGITTGVAYGVLQLLIDPYVLYPLQLVVDYLLAFGALGLSGLFRNSPNGLIKGYLTGVLGRYFFAVLSGWLFFASYAWEGWNPLPYSLIYNGIYIFAETAITTVILTLPAMDKMLNRIKAIAQEP